MNDLTVARVLSLFTDFSDVEYQRESWFGIGKWVSSPDEMCNAIDDMLLTEWVEENAEKMSPFLCRCISEFIAAIDKLPEASDPWAAYFSVEWIQIRLQASVIRDLISKEFKDQLAL
ncbi:hypothetical protein L6172_16330 [Thalassospiraceae bacterium SW-3-3]|uniref:CdiI immunity protein domain-containing protein n=1 Tax=Thalassospira xiamenensis M-5 = DSM 17429 TaxID=1123366 RepID=A0AB72UGH0_9PROT|nr:hypothetical protein [Thalassospira xiamenensis]AJD53263.1 hypothetical protein TH3_15795 [Thalassospira xiamenensis M-5 = DSM 17429]UKV13605.1 hypothetical protein L6172_16330 [Thalassospiraceae bacterium SW-3-3]SIT26295.1 hypothetical protein SAMN02744133_11144 [Thalassospira xiamenensis M-5 = DSM 17429]